MPTDGVNKKRRRFLVATTSAVGAVGAGFAAVPFIKSWKPSAKAQAVGAPVQVSLHGLKPGQILKVQWRGQTIGVHAPIPGNPRSVAGSRCRTCGTRSPWSPSSRPSRKTKSRALKDEFLVVNMHCTHLGCVPQVVPAGRRPAL